METAEMREIAVIVIVVLLAHIVLAIRETLPGSLREFESSDWNQRLADMQTNGASLVQ